jgi:hypothetical protein
MQLEFRFIPWVLLGSLASLALQSPTFSQSRLPTANSVVQTEPASPIPPTSSRSVRTTNIAVGDTIEGQLSQDSQVLDYDQSYYDAYNLEGQTGQRVSIEMTSEDFDAYLILLGSDGVELAQDDDSAGGNNARIDFTLPASGNYLILANSYGQGAVGQYRLVVSSPSR